jgi:hypothetical protein
MRLGALVLVAAVFAPRIHAQFWAKQPYEKWSRGDCNRILKDSPWARTHTIGRAIIQLLEEPAEAPGREPSAQITYVVRLLSAAPVRQAFVRLRQLDPEYNKLTAEQKKDRDERNKKLVESTYADRVVVQIEYDSTVLAYRQELATAWQNQTPEQLKQEIFLVGPRGRVPPARIIISPGASGDIQLIFPRTVEGKPIVEAQDKSFSLEFRHPAVGVLKAERVLTEFKVKDLVVNNELLY